MGGMRCKSCASKVLWVLVVAALALPIMICILLALARLLAVMGDDWGCRVLRYVGLAGGVVWIMALVGLVIIQAIHALGGPDDDAG
jgi:hypothetical protein